MGGQGATNGGSDCEEWACLGNDDEDGHDEHAGKAQQVQEPASQAVHQWHRHQRHRHHDGAHTQVGVLVAGATIQYHPTYHTLGTCHNKFTHNYSRLLY